MSKTLFLVTLGLLFVQTALSGECQPISKMNTEQLPNALDLFDAQLNNESTVYSVGNANQGMRVSLHRIKLKESPEIERNVLVKQYASKKAKPDYLVNMIEKEILMGRKFAPSTTSPRQIAPDNFRCYTDEANQLAFDIFYNLDSVLGFDWDPSSKDKCYTLTYITLPQKQRLAVILDVAENLQALHTRGYSSQNLLPENVGIKLKEDGSFDRAVFLDLSYAQKFGEKIDLIHTITSDMEVLYASTRESKNQYDYMVSPFIDTYALGVFMFQMELTVTRKYNRVNFQDLVNEGLRKISKVSTMSPIQVTQFYYYDDDLLKSMGFFKCVAGGETYPDKKICLYKLFLGLVDITRSSRLTLANFVPKLKFFIDNIESAADLTKEEFKQVMEAGLKNSGEKNTDRIVL